MKLELKTDLNAGVDENGYPQSMSMVGEHAPV